VDRFAIFVDVGYLVASVAELLTASPERSGVTCEYASLVSDLVQEAGRDCGLPVLRTYWYDASLTGLPEHDQQTVADLPGVRLRLGRLVRGGQKGVDSRIVRDLIVLAHDRAMASAYVLAGDEDIREGMEEAQDHGVRVVLWGVPGINQSRVLCQQADEHRILPDEFWLRHFRLVERPCEPSRAGGRWLPVPTTRACGPRSRRPPATATARWWPPGWPRSMPSSERPGRQGRSSPGCCWWRPRRSRWNGSPASPAGRCRGSWTGVCSASPRSVWASSGSVPSSRPRSAAASGRSSGGRPAAPERPRPVRRPAGGGAVPTDAPFDARRGRPPAGRRGRCRARSAASSRPIPGGQPTKPGLDEIVTPA